MCDTKFSIYLYSVLSNFGFAFFTSHFELLLLLLLLLLLCASYFSALFFTLGVLVTRGTPLFSRYCCASCSWMGGENDTEYPRLIIQMLT